MKTFQDTSLKIQGQFPPLFFRDVKTGLQLTGFKGPSGSVPNLILFFRFSKRFSYMQYFLFNLAVISLVVNSNE